MRRSVGEKDAEEIVLGYLAEFECGVTVSNLDTHMLSTANEWMALRDVGDALERCRSNGEADREGDSLWFYRITNKGRERLKAGRTNSS